MSKMAVLGVEIELKPKLWNNQNEDM